MLKELIKMAGEFDRLGLTKEADKVDAMIRKMSHNDDFIPHGEEILDERTPESAILAAEELDELDWADRNRHDYMTEDYKEADSRKEWMQQAEKAYLNRFDTNPEDPPQYTGEFADFLNSRTSLHRK